MTGGLCSHPFAACGGLFAALAVAATVYVAPSALAVTADAPQMSLTASYWSVDAPGTSTTPLAGHRQYASIQRPLRTDFPTRRRRRIHFFNNFTHFGSGGGALSWLFLAPLLIVVLTVAAVPFALRRRFKRRRPQPGFAGPPPFGPTTLPTTVAPPSAGQTTDRLAQLEQLHQSGAISDEEFITQRQRIVGGP